MSFENFDFEIAQIDLLKIFDGSETMPKTGKKVWKYSTGSGL